MGLQHNLVAEQVDGRCIDSEEVLTAAILDWLLHHGTVVNIRGQSYRLKEKLRGGIMESGEPAETRTSKRLKPTSDQA